jgi:ABC-type Fe3+-hydroxamate transport system substrate-binding protein
MHQVVDQVSRTVMIPDRIQRIVSVVPSQTELLFELGPAESVVGITKFCVRPAEWFRNKTRVGGTKQLRPEIIRNLKPDLVLANKEENIADQVNELSREFPVWVSDVSDLADALEMIEAVGEITGTQLRASAIIEGIRDEFESIGSDGMGMRAAYFIWNKPMMVAGGGTFIHEIMGRLGVKNVFGNRTRYPEVTLEELRAAEPELLLLSSEPFPFSQKHVSAFEALCPGANVVLVDGQMFSWYGSRLLHVPKYLASLRSSLRSGDERQFRL